MKIWPNIDDELPDEIYHYTDENGLCGILQEHTLWATHAMYLNDSEEVFQGIRMFQKVAQSVIGAPPPEAIAEFKSDNVAKNALLQMLGRMFGSKLPEHVQQEVDSLIPRYGPFVTCFSEERDRLSQWRGYGRNTGYAIKFDGPRLRQHIRDHCASVQNSDQTANSRLVNEKIFIKMVYDPSELEESTRENIVKLWSTIGFVLSKVVAEDLEPPSDRKMDSIRKILPTLILTALRLKDGGFVEENEYRILAFANPDHFTPTGRGLIPRAEIEFDPKCIKEIIIGPGPDSLTRLSSVEYYKTVNTIYNDVEVTPSSIPFRGI